MAVFNSTGVTNKPELNAFILRTLLLASVLLLYLSGTSLASISIELELPSKTLFLSEEIVLKLKIDGARQGVHIELPSIPGLSFRQIGVPTSTSRIVIINGKKSSFNGLVFNVGISAVNSGDFHVNGISVQYQGRRYKSEPFDIHVKSSDQPTDIKLVTAISKRKIFVQESVDISLKWYLREEIEEYEFQFPLLDRRDEINLTIVEQKKGVPTTNLTINGNTIPFRRFRETLSGKSYTVYATKFRIYPPNSGVFKIPKASLRVLMRVGTELRRDFFGRLVRSPKVKRFFISSSRGEVEVASLPTKNKPPSFTGAVGVFTISTATKATRIKVGDPFELSIKITGTGKLSSIEQPLLNEIPAFKNQFVIVDSFQPGDIRENHVVFKQVIRPRSETVTEIPAVTLSFFNPEIGEYSSVSSEPIPIKVLSVRKVSANDIIAPDTGRNRDSKSLIRGKQGIYANYIFEEAIEPRIQHWNLFLLLIIPPVLYVIVLVLSNKYRKLNSDYSIVRARNADKKKNRRMRALKKIVAMDDDKELFHRELADTIKKFISDKLNLGIGELTAVDVENLGRENSLPPSLIADLSSLLNDLDRHCFTHQRSTIETKRRQFDLANELMRSLSNYV